MERMVLQAPQPTLRAIQVAREDHPMEMGGGEGMVVMDIMVEPEAKVELREEAAEMAEMEMGRDGEERGEMEEPGP